MSDLRMAEVLHFGVPVEEVFVDIREGTSTCRMILDLQSASTLAGMLARAAEGT